MPQDSNRDSVTRDSIFRVVHDDSEILVVEKRKAFNSQRSDEGDREGFYEFVGRSLGYKLLPVHRLDREVLGLMIFAKTAAAAKSLSDQFREREVSKIYLAWVHFKVNPPEQHLVHYLSKNQKKNFVTVYPNPTEGAKKAELKLRALELSNEKSLVEVELLTGRSHQIRAQLAKVGHPIIGDTRYGNRLSERLREHYQEVQIQLRAQSLGVIHPQTNEFLEWKIEFSRESFF
jgi:23S rRNA pseudouridine1911/1915/1917 synthase